MRKKRVLAQPDWVSVDDRLPGRDGRYFTISEYLEGGPGIPIGSVAVNTTDAWRKGKWRLEDKPWKVLYWAKPVKMAIPEELDGRMRLGTL